MKSFDEMKEIAKEISVRKHHEIKAEIEALDLGNEDLDVRALVLVGTTMSQLAGHMLMDREEACGGNLQEASAEMRDLIGVAGMIIREISDEPTLVKGPYDEQ